MVKDSRILANKIINGYSEASRKQLKIMSKDFEDICRENDNLKKRIKEMEIENV